MVCGLYYDLIDKYKVTAELVQPLHVGSADIDRQRILVHPINGNPFVQAAGIAGVFRDAYESFFGNAEGLFGELEKSNEKAKNRPTVTKEDNKVSDAQCYRKIIFTDGWFEKDNKFMELRPSVKLNPVSGTVLQTSSIKDEPSVGHKFETEYLGSGAVFHFYIYIYGTSQTIEKDNKDILTIFAAINKGEIQFGGKKSSGSGKVKINELKYQRYDMKTEDGRNGWINEVKTEPIEDIEIDKIKSPEKSLTAYKIVVEGRTDGPLLVKSIAVNEVGKGAPDYVNIKNSAGDYIIPGTSIKGAVKNRMQFIYDYLNTTREDIPSEIMETAFGKASSIGNTGTSGNIFFCDAIVKKRKNQEMPVIHRVHIDKFTGGVMNGALFSEKPVNGEIKLVISISTKKGQQNADRTCGLLILALRDLAIGRFNLGSGFSVGKGFIKVHKISIKPDINKKAILKFGEHPDIDDKDHIVSKCLRSLAGKE